MHESDFPDWIKSENREASMQIRNATHDRQLDLLDCRATILGFDVYGIESDEIFVWLQRRCFDCSFQKDCAIDLRRDPNDPVWKTYCPNAETLEGLAEDLWLARKVKSQSPQAANTV